MLRHTSIALLLAVLAWDASATSAVGGSPADAGSPATSTHWTPKVDGWHFYRDPVEPAAPPPPEPVKPSAGQGGEPLKPLSSAWFRERLDHYRDLAIDNPTPENVELYGYLQRVMLDKAELFTQAFGAAVASNPDLDETARRDITAPQKMAAREATRASRERVLRDLSQRVGLWYFYASECPYCMRQAPILERFAATHGVSILPVALDGLPSPTGHFPNYVTNAGQAERFGVKVTPTLLMVRPPEEVVSLSEGLRTIQELEDRMLKIAHQKGWIEDADYHEATRGTDIEFIDAASVLAQHADAEDPAVLLAALRAAAGRGTGSPIDSRTEN